MTVPNKTTKSAEANAVLKKIADLLLNENVKATVETVYYSLNKGNDVVLTAEPRIPSKLGSILRIGNQSVNANHARSVKIGKFTMRRWPNGAGFYVITPEGKDYSFEGNLSSNIKTASYIWAAALAKCDKRHQDMLVFLKNLRSLEIKDPKMTRGVLKTKFEEAQAQLESLGIPKEFQKHLRKLHEGRE